MHIRWDKSLETGNQLLDAEHRILVMLYKKLDIAIKTRQPENTLTRIAAEVRKFTDFHFYSEENLMHETGYPGAEIHSKSHTDFLVELNAKIGRLVSHREFPDELLDFVNKWLIEHIVKHDQDLADYVSQSHRRPVAEEIYDDYFCTK